jgi:hypothetical protein
MTNRAEKNWSNIVKLFHIFDFVSASFLKQIDFWKSEESFFLLLSPKRKKKTIKKGHEKKTFCNFNFSILKHTTTFL